MGKIALLAWSLALILGYSRRMSSSKKNVLLQVFSSVVLLIPIFIGAPLVSAKAQAKPLKASDPGFLFQDEVTKEIVIDVHRDHPSTVNPFEELSGKFRPDSLEYRALLVAAGISGDTGFRADENVEVTSLKKLRLKFDQEYDRLLAHDSVESVSTVAPVEDAPPVLPSPVVSASFVEVGDAGFTDPKLGDYRLVPLERGLMMANKSGEKRVFSNRDVLKNDLFSVAIGESVSGERVLAVLHQVRSQEPENQPENVSMVDVKSTVWVLVLAGTRIGWTKTLQFNSSPHDSNRSIAGESPTELSPGSLPSKPIADSSPRLTLSGETVSIAISGSTKTLALKTGEAVGPVSLTPASEN